MEKVRCINVDIFELSNPHNDSLKLLKVGKIYDVEKWVIEDNHCNGVILKDIKSTHSSGGFRVSRFVEENIIK